MFGGIQVNLLKTETVRSAEPVLVGVKVRLKVSVCWWLQLGEVRVDKFHFLAQSPANDEIILIEPQCPGLAVQNFFLYKVFSQTLQLQPGRRTHPGALKLLRQSQRLRLIDYNLFGRYADRAVNQRENHEKPRAQD